MSTMLFIFSERVLTTELYYISGDRALAKKVWQKTWRISISKVPGFMLSTTDHGSGTRGHRIYTPLTQP